jgi:hypothetical protein
MSLPIPTNARTSALRLQLRRHGRTGLTATVRYITGNNVDTGLGYEGRDRERDLDIGYAVQSGVLKGLGIRVRNAMARSNYRSDIDENRLTLVYTWQLF